jgi:hypothetical protein
MLIRRFLMIIFEESWVIVEVYYGGNGIAGRLFRW